MRAAGLICAGLTLLVSRPARAAINDATFVESSFATVPTTITGMEWAPDGSDRLFVLRKQGEVRIVENGALLPTAFATLTPVFTASECGLIGIAFDPDFITNGFVYFFVTVSASEQQIIRYTASGNVGSERTVIVDGLPTRGANHDGGALGFGPDGKLYWAIGDGGNAQGVRGDLSLLYSKVGRANRDGSTPADNPFFDGDGPNNDYIWARGFRNPFTMTFQPATDALWLNVVGTYYEQVFVVNAGDHGGWNLHESNQAPPYITPVISYRTNNNTVWDIAAGGAVRSGGITTLTTPAVHRLRPGAKVTVAAMSDPSFDGTYFVTAVPSTTQLSYAQAGLFDAVSGGGTAASQALGGAITGGAFWDSSAPPLDHRGDYFFGDYNSGLLLRATLDPQNAVTTVDEWGTGMNRAVDMAVGPDGDLYYARTGGQLYRARYAATAQALVVSRLNLRVPEGGNAAFNVRLAIPPVAARTVSVQRLSGDADIVVNEGVSLTFDASNWSKPQRVLLSAATDADSVDDHARIRAASSGLTAQLVDVRVTDDEAFSVIVSPSTLDVVEGESGDLQVSLTQPPPASLQVQVTRSSGDVSASAAPGQLTFDASNWSTPQVVTVTAAEDVDAASGLATVTLAGNGLAPRDVAVAIADNDARAPQLLSTPVTSAIVGAGYQYDVDADALPEPVFVLDQAPSGMTIDPTTGVIGWVPLQDQDEPVTVRVSNGIAPDALQTFEIDVAADQSPTCALTAPVSAAVLAGSDGEFFGDVLDDVGAVRAEFWIDGELSYEDVGDQGHYHFGGSHNLFDTTLLSDGEHVLTLMGYDTAGQSCAAEVTVTIQNDAVLGGDGGAGGVGSDPESGDAGAGGAGSGSEPATGGGGVSAVDGEPAGGRENPGMLPSAGQAGVGLDELPGSRTGADGGCGCRSVNRARAESLPWPALLLGLAVLRRRRGSARRGG